ncbi:methionine ABC transporter ATP-binding protein [Oenococcus oeni]|uniref:methionine ABC transporter ATP-binding protein n=1 Tax=Oenococcus oeni TaxID=1247 RepID=UPI0010B048FB|nr:methionine ABC transporter ATP-binding protein [Oenococcus oeni]SYW20585.1 methionine ABC transporter (ATP-binding protein) [Oenococcus oeni]
MAAFINSKTNIIDLKNITVLFKNQRKEVRAVDNVNLAVERGDIFGIIGYSGAGKSTLVRTINLLQKPTNGSVIVNGIDIKKIDEKNLRVVRHKIGMIFQHFNLMSSRSVLGNIEYPLLDQKINRKKRQQRALELLKLVGLQEYVSAYPSQLSGGQKQRVAIARALANNPEILISDESTSALDPKTTESILELLKDLNKKLNLTIVLITHEMQVIKSICHNVAVMESGKIIEEGKVTDIFIDPSREVTQDFVDTSTNVKNAIKRIIKNTKFKIPGINQELVYLKFVGQSANEGIISKIVKKFRISFNILFANVDQVDGEDIGHMIITFSGEDSLIKKSLDALIKNGVRTQILVKGDT